MTKESLERKVLEGATDLQLVRAAKKSFDAYYAGLLQRTHTSIGTGVADKSGYYIALRTPRYDSALDVLPDTYQSVPVALLEISKITPRD